MSRVKTVPRDEYLQIGDNSGVGLTPSYVTASKEEVSFSTVYLTPEEWQEVRDWIDRRLGEVKP